MLIKAGVDIIQEAKALCVTFMDKVETGRARSTETYTACKNLLSEITKWEKENADKSGS